MVKIIVPKSYNYIAVFLSLSCNLACAYCINLNEEGSTRSKVSRKHANAKEWIEFLNRLEIGRDDLPITLQGGEPTMHKEFYEIVNGVRDDVKLDLLTNFMFDVDEFIAKIDPKKFTRDAKYAAIRVSYHPGQNDIDDLVVRHHKMRDAGFYVGLYAVMTPWNEAHIKEVQAKCLAEGVDFRIKEYLGFDGDKWHGTYRYPEAISQKVEKYCECKTTELIVGPNGGVYRCHSDLYENRTPVSFVTDKDFEIQDIYRPCFVFGHCNPCDIKVKTNRFQEFGHTSVDIQNIRELTKGERVRLENSDYGFGK
jgi:MoaA/NifB/PqqE/SkfB family radical SAM enzyme